MKTEILTVCDRLVADLANGIYQGIIIALLVALALRVLRGTNAATRHAVWFCTLLVLVSLLAVHCLRDFVPSAPQTANPDEKGTMVPEAETGPASSALTSLVMSEPQIAGDPMVAASPTAKETPPADPGESPESNPEPGSETSLLLASGEDVELASSADPQPDPAAEEGQATAAEPGRLLHALRLAGSALVNPVRWEFSLGSKIPRVIGLALLATCAGIAAVRVSILLLRLRGIRRLKRRSRPAGPELTAVFRMLCARLAVNRRVDLRVSPALVSPILLGFLHPAILLPAEETAENAEQVLRHELAHVRRRDDWANLVQHFLHAVFFFHPAVWWISKRLSLEREIACDDHVLLHSGRPRAYALLLANLAGRLQGAPLLLAPGVSTNKSQLQRRIDMILDTKRNASPRLAKTRLGVLATAAVLIAVVATYAAPRVVLAQNETPPPTEETPPPAEVTPPATEETPVAAVAFSSSESAGVSVATATAPVAAVGVASGEAAVLPTPAPEAVGSGPKVKAGTATTVHAPFAVITGQTMPRPGSAPLAVITVPAQPSLPTVASVPPVFSFAPVRPPHLVATVQPGPEPPTPRAARTPRPPGAPGEDSLEKRLERLEQLVQSLVAQQHAKGDAFHFDYKAPEFKFDRKQMQKFEEQAAKFQEMAKQQAFANPKDVEKLQEYAHRQAEYAQRQAEYAQRQVEQAKRESEAAAARSSRDAERNLKDQNRQPRAKSKPGPEKQIEMLRKQVEALEREREKLDRQIEKLEQDQEKLDEEADQTEDANQNEDSSEDVLDRKALHDNKTRNDNKDQPHGGLEASRSTDECVAQAAAK